MNSFLEHMNSNFQPQPLFLFGFPERQNETGHGLQSETAEEALTFPSVHGVPQSYAAAVRRFWGHPLREPRCKWRQRSRSGQSGSGQWPASLCLCLELCLPQ